MVLLTLMLGSLGGLSLGLTEIGIPVDMLENVFELFTQIDRGKDQSARGLGIGLHLVDMHGGSIEINREGDGRGSKFNVYPPVLRELA